MVPRRRREDSPGVKSLRESEELYCVVGEIGEATLVACSMDDSETAEIVRFRVETSRSLTAASIAAPADRLSEGGRSRSYGATSLSVEPFVITEVVVSCVVG